jgi:RNA polymerase sigma factor (TIGR02999 family)
MTDGADGSELIDDPRYQELRRLARRLLGTARNASDPDPTELVHECFLRLAKADGWVALTPPERRAYAARALRNTLIDLRRAEATEKRGGLRVRLTLDDRMAESDSVDQLDLLALSEAIEALAESHPRQAEVVVLRYLGGLTLAEAAAELSIAERTVQTDWNFACAWLHRRLGPRGPEA